MAESFNPYRDWLGLAEGQRPSTHYGLFGLKPLESDEDEIRVAISKVLARVRSIRPGDRVADWQQIINEVSAAKACLTDPDAKAAYDAQLRGGRPAPQAPSRPAPVATPPSSAPAKKKAAPPTAKGKQDTPARQKPIAKAPSRSAATPPTARPAGPTARPAGPTARPAAPTARPVAPAERPAAQPPIAYAPKPSASSAAAPPTPPYAGNPPPGYPPVPAAPPQAYPVDPGQAGPAWPGQPGPTPPVPDPYAAQDAIPFDVFLGPPDRPYRRRSSVAGFVVKFLLSVIVLAALAGGGFKYQRQIKDLLFGPERKIEAVKVAEKPVEKAAAPDPAELAARAAAELAHKKASMQKNLADVVGALAARDMTAARTFAAQARAIAPSPDDQTTVAKYEKLIENLQQFWRIIGDRVGQFQASQEVTLGKTRITVVDAQGGRFSFKYGRKIISCPVDNVPAWLAIALADVMLTGDAQSKEFYGAFLAVDPEGDRTRAKALWAEAAAAGINIDELLPSIDSLPATQ